MGFMDWWKNRGVQKSVLQRDIEVRIKEINARLSNIGCFFALYTYQNCKRCGLPTAHRIYWRVKKNSRIVLGHVLDEGYVDVSAQDLPGNPGPCYVCDYEVLNAWIVKRELQNRPLEAIQCRIAELKVLQQQHFEAHVARMRTIDTELDLLSKQAKVLECGVLPEGGYRGVPGSTTKV